MLLAGLVEAVSAAALRVAEASTCKAFAIELEALRARALALVWQGHGRHRI